MKDSNKFPIYLDYAATTPVDKQVLAAMLPYFSASFGNAASRFHAYGWLAEEAVEEAKKTISKFSGFSQKEIIFTSGATESINLALKGLFENQNFKGHLITVKTEHKATLDTAEYLSNRGVSVSYLPVNTKGEIDLNELENQIIKDTKLISIMQVNNETGLVHPIDKIIEIAHTKNTLVHVDATQAVGKLPFPQKADLVSFSGHKIYAPKGVGLLLAKSNCDLYAQIHGGKHQRNRRSGTLNIPGIVGISKAIETLKEYNEKKLKKLTRKLEAGLVEALDFIQINAKNAERAVGFSNITFKGVDGEELLMRLNKIAVSNGSACNSASTEPSYVLQAMGMSKSEAYSSIRFSLGKYTTESDIDETIKHLISIAKELKHANLR